MKGIGQFGREGRWFPCVVVKRNIDRNGRHVKPYTIKVKWDDGTVTSNLELSKVKPKEAACRFPFDAVIATTSKHAHWATTGFWGIPSFLATADTLVPLAEEQNSDFDWSVASNKCCLLIQGAEVLHSIQPKPTPMTSFHFHNVVLVLWPRTNRVPILNSRRVAPLPPSGDAFIYGVEEGFEEGVELSGDMFGDVDGGDY